VTATSLPIGRRRASWRRIFDRLLVRDNLTKRELLIFLVLQTAATGLLMFQHIVKAGFFSDDYSDQATFRYEVHLGGFARVQLLLPQQPAAGAAAAGGLPVDRRGGVR